MKIRIGVFSDSFFLKSPAPRRTNDRVWPETAAPPFWKGGSGPKRRTARACLCSCVKRAHSKTPAVLLSTVIAENSVELQKRYAAALRRLKGFRIGGIASNALELEQRLQQGGVHLVVLDMFLKGWDGLEALRRARFRHPQVGWVVLSMEADPEIIKGSLCLGIFDYLIKPFPTKRLEAAVAAYSRYHGSLTQRMSPWEQNDLDRVTGLGQTPDRKNSGMPKGIQAIFLQRVRDCLGESENPRTSAEVGGLLGVSRGTARRYLEYLAETGEVLVEYGATRYGRPPTLYHLDRSG